MPIASTKRRANVSVHLLDPFGDYTNGYTEGYTRGYTRRLPVHKTPLQTIENKYIFWNLAGGASHPTTPVGAPQNRQPGRFRVVAAFWLPGLASTDRSVLPRVRGTLVSCLATDRTTDQIAIIACPLRLRSATLLVGPARVDVPRRDRPVRVKG